MRSNQEPNNHYLLMQSESAPDTFASLVTSAELTQSGSFLGTVRQYYWSAHSATGGEDPAGRDRPRYELSRTIYGHSIWIWQHLNSVLRTEQLGRHLWKRLCH